MFSKKKKREREKKKKKKSKENFNDLFFIQNSEKLLVFLIDCATTDPWIKYCAAFILLAFLIAF